MNKQSVIGVYGSMDQAEDAVRALSTGGFPIEQISVVAQDLQSEKQVHGYVTTGDVAKDGAATGAWVGGLFGVLVGAAFMWVPGFGPLLIAGPLAAILIGGLEGALAGAAGGGLMGALVGWGVSSKHILKYEEHVKGGKYLVIAHGTSDQVMTARDILGHTNVEEVNLHTEDAPQPVAQ
jgi:hypothetical protein